MSKVISSVLNRLETALFGPPKPEQTCLEQIDQLEMERDIDERLVRQPQKQAA